MITAEELERMSAAEQAAAFEASIVWDLDNAPQDLVARALARIEQRIAQERPTKT